MRMRSLRAVGCNTWRGALAAMLLACGTTRAASLAVQAQMDPVEIGRRIYREGLLPTGEPLRGVGQAGVTLAGKSAACTTCHRRSGYGSSEGTIEVRAITGPALFGDRVAPVVPGSSLPSRHESAPPSPRAELLAAAEAARANAVALRAARLATVAGTRQRPVYDEESLARAVREGVDVTGHGMNAAMPRYGLDATSLASLTAYLKTLSTQTSPGVTDDAVHFATVIQPGTDPAQSHALVEVLQTFIRDRNNGLLDEVQRQSAGRVSLGRKYRDWVLHVWALTGTGDTWAHQLEAYNREQPVFALVSGLGHASWQPIHDFSERFELPCILPQAAMPVLDAPNFYTVYLSKGMTLEAQALAKHLRDADERSQVIQVFRRNEESKTAAAAFRSAYTDGAAADALQDLALDAVPDAAYWRELAQHAQGKIVVLWLSPEDLAQAQALLAPHAQPKAVFLSASLVGEPRQGIAADGGGLVRLVYPLDPPALRETRLAVVRRWLTRHGIAPADETVQMNAYLAATITGMLLSHSKDMYSREFMIERMEHRLGTAVELSIYPHLSLGPGQRFASKGSYIVGVSGQDGKQLVTLSDWIVP
jgi:hypothetical protein